MYAHTTPAIEDAQNTEQAQRLIAAQARLYSDVKRASATRFYSVLLIAIALCCLSIVKVSDVAVGTIGGAIVLVLQAVFSWREHQKVSLASSIQEQFDTTVFQLPWNEVLVRQRPNGQDISRAASRYTDDRTRNWYPPTRSIARPLDVVICQQSNVGWGIPVHRIWSWTIISLTVIGVVILGAIWKAASLTLPEGLDAVVVPFLPVIWEIFERTRSNFASAKEKEEVQQLMLADWASALSGASRIPIERCRLFQDQIVIIRRTNAHVPDWFDRKLRGRNERAMRTTSHDMVEEAKRMGFA
jgi:hypothetical protein